MGSQIVQTSGVAATCPFRGQFCPICWKAFLYEVNLTKTTAILVHMASGWPMNKEYGVVGGRCKVQLCPLSAVKSCEVCTLFGKFTTTQPLLGRLFVPSFSPYVFSWLIHAIFRCELLTAWLHLQCALHKAHENLIGRRPFFWRPADLSTMSPLTAAALSGQNAAWDPRGHWRYCHSKNRGVTCRNHIKCT